MDRAYWISWYDLPEESRDAYLAWAHEIYIPKVLSRSGVIWAAHYASQPKGSFTPLGGGGRISHKKDPAGVPKGDRFIMMFGAADPYVLASPSPREFHASLRESDRRMLAQRVAERVNLMIEESRIYGPAAHAADPASTPAAPCIQLGSFNVQTFEEEEALAAWYARWRMPSMQKVPGCVRVRKLVSVAGWAKHACFYEFTSLKDREDHFVYYERPYPEMVEWSTNVVRDTVHAPGSANVALRIWPPEPGQRPPPP
jgi:hypothetical protein